MIHLHGHSHYSMLQAIWDTKSIASKAKELWQEAIAITDTNAGYGLLEFYEKTDWIKPVLGVDLNFSYDGKNIMNIVLLAKTYEGYQNLIKLISIANTVNIIDIPFIAMNDLKKYRKWLIGLSWWNWEIEKLIVWWEKDALILEKIQEYEDLFDWEFYLEFLTYDYSLFPERQKIEEKFIQFMENDNKKIVISSNYKYLNKEDRDTYDVLLCIKNNWKYWAENRPRPKWYNHIMTEEEVRAVLENNWLSKDLQDILIGNTHKIAESIDCKIPLHQLLFPKYEVPEKYRKLYDKLEKI